MTRHRYFRPPQLRLTPGRLGLFFCLLALPAMAMIVAGIWRLHGFYPKLQNMMREVYEIRRVIPSHRGTITDRNYELLAMSANLYDATADPNMLRKMRPERWRETAGKAAAILSLDAEEVRRKLSADSRFVFLKRKIPPAVAAKLRALKARAIAVQYESARFYPGREIAAPFLGYINERGGQGVEIFMNSRMRSEDGEMRGVQTTHGAVFEERSLRPAKNGGRLRLSIDSRLQSFVYNAAIRALQKHRARAVSAAVMDARSGEILALVSAPSFNPNHIRKSDFRNSGERTKNRVVADLVECGSLAKPFVVALALELNLAREEEMLPTAKPVAVGRLIVRDNHIREDLTVAEVLTRSSNVGAYLLAKRVGKKRYYDFLRDLGFGEKIFGLRGEAAGRVRHYKEWRREDFATHAYGYGFAATLLQLLRAYSVFAADGMLLEPRLSPEGAAAARRALSAQTARRVRNVMSGVTEGTGKRAAVKGYAIAGKTGTANKFVGGEYDDKKKRAFFVGMAPAAKPRYLIAVMVDEPSQNGESGGSAAAPVFSEIMRRALLLGGIAPLINNSEKESGGEDAV